MTATPEEIDGLNRLVWACDETEACGWAVVDSGKIRVADLRMALAALRARADAPPKEMENYDVHGSWANRALAAERKLEAVVKALTWAMDKIGPHFARTKSNVEYCAEHDAAMAALSAAKGEGEAK